MKKVSILMIAFLSFASLNVFAGVENLDVVPQTKNEVEKLIRVKKIELDIADSNAKNYAALFEDATATALSSRILFTVSSMFLGAGILQPGLVASHMALLYPIAGYNVTTLAGAKETRYYEGRFDASEEAHFAEMNSKDKTMLHNAFKWLNDSSLYNKLENNTYKYSEVYTDIGRVREDIMNSYFDGSAKNMLMDHIRLGGLSKAGARKLMIVAALKSGLLYQELEDLKAIQKSLASNKPR